MSLTSPPTPSPGSREYLKITPSGTSYPLQTIPEILSSLHTLEPADTDHGLIGRLMNSHAPATFTFTVLAGGADAPIAFYLGTDANLDAVADRLRTIYPQSYEIERVECDLLQRLLPPVEYTREEFRARLNDQRLYIDPDAGARSDAAAASAGEDESSARASSTNTQQIEIEYEDGIVEVAPPTALPSTAASETTLAGPTLTPGGTILARPAVFDETVDQHAITWRAETPKQHDDWTTTLLTLEEWFTQQPDNNEAVADAPLGALIETLSDAPSPIGFQVVFQGAPDWTATAEQRRRKVHEGDNIGLPAKILRGILKSILPSPPQDVQAASRRRQAIERSQGPKAGSDNAKRLQRLNQSWPSTSFEVNIHAISLCPHERVDTDASTSPTLPTTLDRLQSALDPLGGRFYRPTSTRHGPETGTQSTVATLVQQFVEPSIRTGRTLFGKRRHPRPEFILSPAELASFILVPSATQLSDQAARAVQSRQVARTPELEPEPQHLAKLTNGLALGTPTQPSTASRAIEPPSPVHLLPSQLPYHYLRAAVSGAGKSIGLQNDGLSLAEDTQGPVIMVDAKGGDMLTNFMRAYGKQYGMERLEEDVLYFPVPDILPGLSIFDVRDVPPDKREQAVRERAAYYEEILQLVMGTDAYQDAKNAPQFIRAVIEALFDPEHGCDNGRYRASADYFRHEQLEYVIDEFQRAVSQGDGGSIPDSTQDHVVRALRRRLGYNKRTIRNILAGVTTRTGNISENSDLRPLFNNTTRTFDFGELLETDKIILFDLGGLRADPSRLMTGVLLTSLYDELKRHKDALQDNPEDYVVNFLIDEAASVTVSDTMTTLLKEGREFQVGIGLATQFPEQLRLEGNEHVYLNALNNIGTKIIGKVAVDDELAETLATEKLPPVAVKTRFRAMPRGEFFVSMPSSTFGETGPTPFSVKPMPIPAGHPKSDDPLTSAEEADFQEALDRIKARTDEEYGIVEEELSLLTDVPPSVQEIVDVDSPDLDRVLVSVIAAVQCRDGARETNGWVTVAAVNETIETCYESAGCISELPAVAELLQIEQRSYLFETDRADRQSAHTSSPGFPADAFRIRLSEAGEQLVDQPATPDGRTTIHQTAGSQQHAQALKQIQAALEPDGWTVTIPEQDGRALPDARAVHPSLDAPVHLEAELSTAEKPAKVLQNLRKAQESGATPVFVVQADPDELAYWARTVDGILHTPVRSEPSNDGWRYYTTDSPITFDGPSHVDGPVTALRPTVAAEDSHQSVWRYDAESEESVLVAPNGTEHLRIETFDGLTPADFPAVSWHDPDTDETVVVAESDELRYDSDELYHRDWVDVRWPFVPERELPDPDYGREEYVIVVLPPEHASEIEDPMIYHPTKQLTPLSSLVECIIHGPDGRGTAVSSDSPAGSPTETLTSPEATEPSISGWDGFFELCVFHATDVEHDPSLAETAVFHNGDIVLPKDRLFTAAERWATITSRSFEKSVFARDILPQYIERVQSDRTEEITLETVRRKIDGNRIYCYKDLGLTEGGTQMIR